MKKLISAILSIFVVAVAVAQNYPVTQNLGNTPNTLVQTNSIRAGQGIILGSFTDTAAANALPYLKNYTGAAIWCTADSSIYVRQKSSTAAFWFKIGGAGGGASGSYWSFIGNFFPAIPANFGLGTNDETNLPIKTNNITRLTIPYYGLSYMSASTDSILVRDASGNVGLIPKSGGGATPTLQQVLTAGSTLTTNFNYVNLDTTVLIFQDITSRDLLTIDGRRSDLQVTIDVDDGDSIHTGASFTAYSGSHRFDIVSNNDIGNASTEASIYGLGSTGELGLKSFLGNSNDGSFITLRKDSISLMPDAGIANIDSLRTWSGISDTTYKKPMTWDTRNGRWEYATNWYGSGSSSVALSAITAATGSNTIDNGSNAQVWNWNSLTSGTGLKLSSSSISSGKILQIEGTGTDANGHSLLDVVANGSNGGSGRTTYAAAFTNTRTGTTSTNVAGLFQASGGTTNIGVWSSLGSIRAGSLAGENGRFQLMGSSSGTITMTAASSAGTYTLTLPTTDGNSGEFLQTDGSGVLTWAAASGGSPAGNFGNLQINRNGALATPASDSLDFESATGLTVKGGIRGDGLGIGVASPTATYMAEIKGNSSRNTALRLSSDQTSPVWLSFETDAYGQQGYYTSGFNRVSYVIPTSRDFAVSAAGNTVYIIDVDNGMYFSRRLQPKQGADVASAAGAITLGGDGNVFEITGTSAITAINNTNWQNGATVTLLFTSTASLTHGTANSGTSIGFELAGAANFNGTAGDVVVLVLSEIGGTQRWRMVSASVN